MEAPQRRAKGYRIGYEFGSGETRLIRFIRRRRDAPDLGGDLRGLLEAFGKQPGLFAPHP